MIQKVVALFSLLVVMAIQISASEVAQTVVDLKSLSAYEIKELTGKIAPELTIVFVAVDSEFGVKKKVYLTNRNIANDYFNTYLIAPDPRSNLAIPSYMKKHIEYTPQDAELGLIIYDAGLTDNSEELPELTGPWCLYLNCAK